MSTGVLRADVAPGSARASVDDGPPTTVDDDDPREHIEVGVLRPNGKLVGRQFASRAEAEAWARPEEGEQVVEYNLVCDCSM